MATSTTATTSSLAYHILGYGILIAAIALFFGEWRASQRDLANMKTSIAKTEQQRATVIAGAAAKVQVIRAAAKAAKTPQQQIQEINTNIPLPSPIVAPADTPDQHGAGPAGGSGAAPLPDAVIPQVDLKPLADFSAACAECQVKEAADQQQIKQLTSERDYAVKTAKGGSFWQRTRKVVKYVAIGVAIGAVTVAVTKK